MPRVDLAQHRSAPTYTPRCVAVLLWRRCDPQQPPPVPDLHPATSGVSIEKCNQAPAKAVSRGCRQPWGVAGHPQDLRTDYPGCSVDVNSYSIEGSLNWEWSCVVCVCLFRERHKPPVPACKARTARCLPGARRSQQRRVGFEWRCQKALIVLRHCFQPHNFPQTALSHPLLPQKLAASARRPQPAGWTRRKPSLISYKRDPPPHPAAATPSS